MGIIQETAKNKIGDGRQRGELLEWLALDRSMKSSSMGTDQLLSQSVGTDAGRWVEMGWDSMGLSVDWVEKVWKSHVGDKGTKQGHTGWLPASIKVVLELGLLSAEPSYIKLR